MKTSEIVQIGSDSSAKRQETQHCISLLVPVLAAFFLEIYHTADAAMDAVESVKWVDC